MARTVVDQIIARIHAHGGELTPLADGSIRYRGAPLTSELRALLREYKAPLIEALGHPLDSSSVAEPELVSNDPVACRGCATLIPAGTTLCVECGSAHSPIVRHAVQLVSETERRTLRGRALIALDRKHYPRLQLADGRSIGPGLLAWCSVLREADRDLLTEITQIAKHTRSAPAPEAEP